MQSMRLLLLAFVGLGLALAGEAKVVRVGLQAGGTFAWAVYAMERYGILKAWGLRLRPRPTPPNRLPRWL